MRLDHLLSKEEEVKVVLLFSYRCGYQRVSHRRADTEASLLAGRDMRGCVGRLTPAKGSEANLSVQSDKRRYE